ncbi:MAG: DsrE family protein [Nitrososphaeraceae archaeon]
MVFVVVATTILIPVSYNSSYAQNESATVMAENSDPLVYHLSSDDPWRASIALSDAINLKSLGHNVTLMLSIEGVQVGVNNPHNFLALGNVINNVTDFIDMGGKVVVCEICLEIAGYEKDDLIDGTILGTPEVSSRILTNATVVDY